MSTVKTKPIKEWRIVDLPLPTRARNRLPQVGITTVEQLIDKSEEDLIKIRNVSFCTLKGIKKFLSKHDLKLQSPHVLPLDFVRSKPIKEWPIEDLPLPTRARRCLPREGIFTIGDIIKWSEEDLMTIRNFSATSLKAVKKFLSSHGLSLHKAYASRCTREMIIEGLADSQLRLTNRERKILTMRFGLEGNEPMRLQQVCKTFNLTRERVRQIQKLAEQKIIAHLIHKSK